MIVFAPVLCNPALSTQTPAPAQRASPSAKPRKLDFVAKVNRALNLRPDQVGPVDDLVRSHEEKIRAILDDPSIGRIEKALEVRDKIQAMILELTPLLTRAQVEDLHGLFYGMLEPWPHAKIAIDFSDYLPSSATTRSIFGKSLSAFGVGFGGDEKVKQRSVFGFGVDLFDMPSYSNRLFVLAPQATYEYRMPIRTRMYAYAGAAAGPSYMDYSYDLPDGEHFAGKNLGLDGSLDFGVQWGPLRVGASYRVFTQPSGLNFDGFDVYAALTVLRF